MDADNPTPNDNPGQDPNGTRVIGVSTRVGGTGKTRVSASTGLPGRSRLADDYDADTARVVAAEARARMASQGPEEPARIDFMTRHIATGLAASSPRAAGRDTARELLAVNDRAVRAAALREAADQIPALVATSPATRRRISDWLRGLAGEDARDEEIPFSQNAGGPKLHSELPTTRRAAMSDPVIIEIDERDNLMPQGDDAAQALDEIRDVERDNR